MTSSAFTVSTLVNKEAFAYTLIDTGCLCYGVINEKFVRKHSLQRVPITGRDLLGIGGERTYVREVAEAQIDIDGHTETAYFYILPASLGYDLILGKPWMNKNDVRLEPRRNRLYVKSSGIRVRNSRTTSLPPLDIARISAVAFSSIYARKKKIKQGTEVFTVSLTDIQKALKPKKRTDPRTKLPD